MSLACHNRNRSASEQLIESVAGTSAAHSPAVELVAQAPNNEVMFSNFSDCSSYYGLPNSQNENEARYLFKNPYLRANVRVVIGSVLLTIVGTMLVAFDVHGWIFLVVGVLFFIPGFYHLVYIMCTLCGRPGYSFENLPTFSKPNA